MRPHITAALLEWACWEETIMNTSADTAANTKTNLSSDYLEGAHPAVLAALVETNFEQSPGYGTDAHSERARELIRKACDCPDAQVFFLVGGTQANATVIDMLLEPYEGVIAPQTGHIATHEAGAIEGGGHKIFTVEASEGKIDAATIECCIAGWEQDGNRDHMVKPALVYLSQPTEYGTLYSCAELEAIANVCHAHETMLYVDGARLAYALACLDNDVSLIDLARLTDAFYIGGTKCGALFGEAVVVPNRTLPHLTAQIKQHGALFAKGRILGVQFETLFDDTACNQAPTVPATFATPTNNPDNALSPNILYHTIGLPAIEAAEALRAGLRARGYELFVDAPTNQVFVAIDDAELDHLARFVEYSFWEKLADGRTVIRLATSWATRMEEIAVALDYFRPEPH